MFSVLSCAFNGVVKGFMIATTNQKSSTVRLAACGLFFEDFGCFFPVELWCNQNKCLGMKTNIQEQYLSIAASNDIVDSWK